ncbi:uncharacterized protein LOC129230575 [Uloborus diversus]|uniref:uncharacterized protein LOC129230575 n=1 Tax=Uloborus diversus TaxID=327109 RepID=UPI00240A7306|nr:uncharacterized protein LOC129230575 [Uloborus diversus]
MSMSSYFLMILLHCVAAFEEFDIREQLKRRDFTLAEKSLIGETVPASNEAFRITEEKENILGQIVGESTGDVITSPSLKIAVKADTGKKDEENTMAKLDNGSRGVECNKTNPQDGRREEDEEDTTEKLHTGNRRVVCKKKNPQDGHGEEEGTTELVNGNGGPIIPPSTPRVKRFSICPKRETLGCKQLEMTCQKKEDLKYASQTIFWQQVTIRPPIQCNEESCVCAPGFIRDGDECVHPIECFKPPTFTKPPSKKG